MEIDPSATCAETVPHLSAWGGEELVNMMNWIKFIVLKIQFSKVQLMNKHPGNYKSISVQSQIRMLRNGTNANG